MLENMFVEECVVEKREKFERVVRNVLWESIEKMKIETAIETRNRKMFFQRRMFGKKEFE